MSSLEQSMDELDIAAAAEHQMIDVLEGNVAPLPAQEVVAIPQGGTCNIIVSHTSNCFFS